MSLWNRVKTLNYRETIKSYSSNHQTALNQIISWMLIGSLALEIKWQRKEIRELEKSLYKVRDPQSHGLVPVVPIGSVTMESMEDVELY
jgi:hypothetical protein